MSDDRAGDTRQEEHGQEQEQDGHKLSWSQRRFLALLGAPAMGMALAVTVVSSYLPVLIEQISGPVLVGALIGGEGFFGIFMPTIVGGFSDRKGQRVRDRLRLALSFAVLVAVAMAGLAIIAGSGWGSIIAYAVVLSLLYAAYYAFLAPYWSTYPDLVPDEQSGRSRSAESTWRVTGVGLALIGGGLLLDIWAGLPFAVAAVLVLATIGAFTWGLRERLDDDIESGDDESGSVKRIRKLLEDRDIRILCIANGMWNFALASLRAFVVLFFTIGMDRSTTFVSTVIFPMVAVGIAVAAPTAGWVADRWGHVRLLTVALSVYGVGMAIPAFLHDPWVIGLIPVVAAGAAAVMTLPFSVLMRLLPEENHGSASGLFGFSRGIGAALGPLVTGLAILLLRPVLDGTKGYGAMWLVCSVTLLASIPLLWSLRHNDNL